MSKIEINLYPYQGSQERGFVQILEQFFPYVFLGGILLLFLNVILYFASGFFSAPYNRLSNEWTQSSAKVRFLEQTQKSDQELQAKEKRYKDLFSSQLVFSDIFSEVYKALPENVWFESITYSGESIIFSGYVVKWKEDYMVSVDSFVKGLKQSPYFSKEFKVIEPKGTRKDEFNGVEVTKFEVECRK
jgi:Tfp pilus assembly protein PilN